MERNFYYIGIGLDTQLNCHNSFDRFKLLYHLRNAYVAFRQQMHHYRERGVPPLDRVATDHLVQPRVGIAGMQEKPTWKVHQAIPPSWCAFLAADGVGHKSPQVRNVDCAALFRRKAQAASGVHQGGAQREIVFWHREARV